MAGDCEILCSSAVLLVMEVNIVFYTVLKSLLMESARLLYTVLLLLVMETDILFHTVLVVTETDMLSNTVLLLMMETDIQSYCYAVNGDRHTLFLILCSY